MNSLSTVFLLVVAYYLFRLPKAWAALPLLAGACYMTLGQEMVLGPFHFTVIRILVAVGGLRVASRKERIAGGWTPLDRIMVAWGIWGVFSSCFHKDFSSALVSRLGMVYDGLGLYFLLRVFIEGIDGIVKVCKIVIILLIPIALEMGVEHFRGTNAFAVLGGIPEECEVRGGKIRAQGPFSHSILAGTVGAVCWPMALMLWRENCKLALVGLAATGTIVLASSSSGPIMTSAFVLLGFALWRARRHMRLIRWGVVVVIIALDIVLKAPV